ncbi:hypothetical protein KUD11_13050 [Roseovarius sp. LXJ103]|uniref:hypothetical protein n=1 Tax=Roseovarius carneus TaxID=2853164 RepID=UPI000D689BB7|nr:hypothetical protein [Roseovarius carneus]MBZ8119571.1 hypothetical protein [Roseovarius carneus]
MPELWEYMCEESDEWSVNTYRSDETQAYKRKAGVAAFDNKVKMTADETLWRKAKEGCKLSNFILAHEMGHVALGHHDRSAVTKNFQLFSGPNGMSNIPPTLEELETNFAAVFLQCGVALEDKSRDPLQLAHRACSDVYYIKRAQRFVQLDVFQRELLRPKRPVVRVVL